MQLSALLMRPAPGGGSAFPPALARACRSNSPQRASSASEVPNWIVGRIANGANKAARPAAAPARAATSAPGRIFGSLNVPLILIRVGSDPTEKCFASVFNARSMVSFDKSTSPPTSVIALPGIQRHRLEIEDATPHTQIADKTLHLRFVWNPQRG